MRLKPKHFIVAGLVAAGGFFAWRRFRPAKPLIPPTQQPQAVAQAFQKAATAGAQMGKIGAALRVMKIKTPA